MLLQDLAGDGKPQTRAAGLARARLVHAVEPLKQPRQILLGDADAVVGHAHIDGFLARADVNFDFAAVGRVFDGIGDDVHDHLLDALAVAVDLGDVVLAGKRHRVVVVLLGVEPRGLVHVLHGLGKGEAADVHFHLAVVDLAEREQILHDARHAVGLVDDDAEEIGAQLTRQLVSRRYDRLGVGLDVGQRRAQLVRDVGHKFSSRLFALSLLGHVVDDDQYAALRLIRGERRQKQLQLPLAHGFLPLDVLRPFEREQRVQLRFFSENLVERRRGVKLPREHLRRGGVEVDDRAGGRKRHHAVGHVQKQRRELVSLILGLGDGVLQHLRHVVEVSRQNADLVVARRVQPLLKIAGRDLSRAARERAQRRDEDLRQQHRQHQTDHKSQRQRFDDDAQHLICQRVYRGLGVQNIDDVALRARLNGHGQIHRAAAD